jgi:hypothetical protein
VQDFDAAAGRHLDDAVLLDRQGRLPNADHLAGFAVECAPKEMLICFLGATPTNSRPFSIQSGSKVIHGHLPKLWYEVGTALAGRTGGSAIALILSNDPFNTWDVNDRYGDCRGLAPQIVADRLSVAGRS